MRATFNVIHASNGSPSFHNLREHGPNYNYAGQGGLIFFADSKPISSVAVDDLLIDSPILSGIQFSGGQNISNVTLNNSRSRTPAPRASKSREA